MEAEDVEALQSVVEVTKAKIEGRFQDVDKLDIPCLTAMARNIQRQKQRIGGTWAVAQLIMTRKQRDELKRQLGPELVFLVLNMTEECQAKRLDQRYGADYPGLDFIKAKARELHASYQLAGEDEANAFNVEIGAEMTPEDVLNNVLEVIENIKNIQDN